MQFSIRLATPPLNQLSCKVICGLSEYFKTVTWLNFVRYQTLKALHSKETKIANNNEMQAECIVMWKELPDYKKFSLKLCHK